MYVAPERDKALSVSRPDVVKSD